MKEKKLCPFFSFMEEESRGKCCGLRFEDAEDDIDVFSVERKRLCERQTTVNIGNEKRETLREAV
jgi:hypothetical protein